MRPFSFEMCRPQREHTVTCKSTASLPAEQQRSSAWCATGRRRGAGLPACACSHPRSWARRISYACGRPPKRPCHLMLPTRYLRPIGCIRTRQFGLPASVPAGLCAESAQYLPPRTSGSLLGCPSCMEGIHSAGHQAFRHEPGVGLGAGRQGQLPAAAARCRLAGIVERGRAGAGRAIVRAGRAACWRAPHPQKATQLAGSSGAASACLADTSQALPRPRQQCT